MISYDIINQNKNLNCFILNLKQRRKTIKATNFKHLITINFKQHYRRKNEKFYY